MLQRHAAYLQRGQRFGSFARGGGLHLSSKERKQTEEELNQAEIKIDALLSGKDVDLECKEMQNCVVNINAKLSGRLTHEVAAYTPPAACTPQAACTPEPACTTERLNPTVLLLLLLRTHIHLNACTMVYIHHNNCCVSLNAQL